MFNQLMKSYNLSEINKLQKKFESEQIIIFDNLLSKENFLKLKREVLKLNQSFIRRDFLMEESENTPRKLSTINTMDIKSHSLLIPSLYSDSNLLNFLSQIANEKIYSLKNKFESFTINSLHKQNDTHGGHIDDYPYAFNIIIEAPLVGGELELVLNSTQVADLDNKQLVKRYMLTAGTCYFLKSDVNVHRVSELQSNDARTIINFSYSDFKRKDLTSYSSSSLYGTKK